MPEIAFIGRSNVGKSSLLNSLTGRKGLARVSGTPGKTQHMNMFRLPTFYMVDLPGYGFAHANKGMRAGYRKLVEGYLTKREQLKGVVWLLDIRHEPSKDDLTFQDLLAESGRPGPGGPDQGGQARPPAAAAPGEGHREGARPHGGVVADREQRRGHGNRRPGREHQGGGGSGVAPTP